MKKTLLVVLLSSVISTGAYAAACGAASATAIAAGATTGGTAATEQCICGGSTARKNTVNGGSGQVNSTPIFVKNGFDVQCSANVFASYNEVSSTFFAVGSASAKGNQSMMGHTAGGAVTTSAKCTSACAGTDVTTATAAAVTAGSSL